MMQPRTLYFSKKSQTEDMVNLGQPFIREEMYLLLKQF